MNDNNNDKDDVEVLHENGGAIENPSDAFEMIRWFSKTIRDAYEDGFGRGIWVKVAIKIKYGEGGR